MLTFRAGGFSGGGGASGGWQVPLAQLKARVEAINSTHNSNYVSMKGHVQNLLNWQTSAKVQLGQINGIKNDVNSLKAWKNTTDQKIISLESRTKTHDAWAWNKYVETGKKFGEDRSRLKNLEEGFSKQKAWAWDRYVEQNGKFSADRERLKSLEEGFSKQKSWAWDRYVEQNGKFSEDRSRLNGLEKFQTSQNSWNATQLRWNTAQSNRINKLEVNDINLFNRLETENKERIGKDVELRKALVNESEERKAIENALSLKSLFIDDSLEKMNNRINNLSFDFSDVGIIAAILSLNKSNENLWNAENYDGGSVNENDGKAVRLFKNQFQGLKTHYAGIMKYYFDMDDKDSAIYKLRYSIVAGFEETKAILVEWFTLFLESGNTTNNHLNSVNGWLELQDDHFNKSYEILVIITEWLEHIFKKPPPVVNVTIPPFEVSEIKNMPDINLAEKGNGWLKTLIKTVGDVMKTAIETLGSVLETAISEVSALLGDLLKFLDGLIEDLIRLVVPENFDFLDKDFGSLKVKFDVKFGDILNIGEKIKDTFTPNKKDFFKAISFTYMGATFEPNSSATDIYVPMFRLATQVLIWLYVIWFAFEKATGKGDLINDN